MGREAHGNGLHGPGFTGPTGVRLIAAHGGMQVVILGDTCDSRGIAPVAQHADILVHESTFQNALQALAHRAGQSTAGMAGAFARQINAQSLILTHFSCRYPSVTGGKLSAAAEEAAIAAAEGYADMQEELRSGSSGPAGYEESSALAGLVREAQAAMGRGPGAVVAAFDYMRRVLPSVPAAR